MTPNQKTKTPPQEKEKEKTYITINISTELLKEIRAADPTLKTVPATHITDIALREKLRNTQTKNERGAEQ